MRNSRVNSAKSPSVAEFTSKSVKFMSKTAKLTSKHAKSPSVAEFTSKTVKLTSKRAKFMSKTARNHECSGIHE
ncbi:MULTISPECIES: hypothetical protein [unclassified Peribacillus]|uniref:hypothetical protein n=1 Tax=unclassified Peribacillus TaxID=2675266 RepID=UPI00367280A6